MGMLYPPRTRLIAIPLVQPGAFGVVHDLWPSSHGAKTVYQRWNGGAREVVLGTWGDPRSSGIFNYFPS
jgi:hypothetical protein